jgi:hypothetical protein
MSDPIISLFIDDELDLNGKIELVENIYSTPSFKDETIGLLNQEKLIRSDVVDYAPAISIKMKQKTPFRLFRPVTLVPSAVVLALIILMFLFIPAKPDSAVPYRFVIYRPDVSRAEITGTFTGWSRIPMKRIGSSGYWEITLDLPREEHRFTYILEGDQRFADPTILTHEGDDFGGENSVLRVNGREV